MRRSILLLLACAPLVGQAQIVHTFDADAQGWTRGDWVQAPGTLQNLGALTWLNSDGFPAACIQHTDVTNDWFVFLAPAAFTGNQSASVGGELSFDYRLQSSSSLNNIPWVAMIVSGSDRYYYPNISYGMNLWQKVRVPLVGSYGWRRNSPTGAIVTDAEFASAMANVTQTVIMGDWRSGTDITKLDNIAIGNATPSVVNSTFTGSAENWLEVDVTLQNPAVPTGGKKLAVYASGFGNPAGSIQFQDGTTNVSMFEPSQAMTGNLSAYFGGSLRWDFQSVGPGTPLAENYAHAVLTGGGMHLIYLAPELNTILPTTFQDFSVPLSPSSRWRKDTPNGPVPTAAEFQRVLHHVERTLIKAEYRSGDETNRVDNVRFEPGISTAVSGKVSLGADYDGPVAGLPITVTAYRGEFPMDEFTTTLSGAGDYSGTITTSGTVTLRIKASHWLRKASASFVSNGGPVSGLNVSLINGDCDGDNTIGTDDYLLLNGAFDTVPGDALFDARADLNGDESVGTDDYLILNAVFDTSGD